MELEVQGSSSTAKNPRNTDSNESDWWKQEYDNPKKKQKVILQVLPVLPPPSVDTILMNSYEKLVVKFQSDLDFLRDEERGDGRYDMGRYGNCYECGRRGHWAFECPDLHGFDSDGSDESVDLEEVAALANEDIFSKFPDLLQDIVIESLDDAVKGIKGILNMADRVLELRDDQDIDHDDIYDAMAPVWPYLLNLIVTYGAEFSEDVKRDFVESMLELTIYMPDKLGEDIMDSLLNVDAQTYDYLLRTAAHVQSIEKSIDMMKKAAEKILDTAERKTKEGAIIDYVTKIMNFINSDRGQTTADDHIVTILEGTIDLIVTGYSHEVVIAEPNAGPARCRGLLNCSTAALEMMPNLGLDLNLLKRSKNIDKLRNFLYKWMTEKVVIEKTQNFSNERFGMAVATFLCWAMELDGQANPDVGHADAHSHARGHSSDGLKRFDALFYPVHVHGSEFRWSAGECAAAMRRCISKERFIPAMMFAYMSLKSVGLVPKSPNAKFDYTVDMNSLDVETITELPWNILEHSENILSDPMCRECDREMLVQILLANMHYCGYGVWSAYSKNDALKNVTCYDPTIALEHIRSGSAGSRSHVAHVSAVKFCFDDVSLVDSGVGAYVEFDESVREKGEGKEEDKGKGKVKEPMGAPTPKKHKPKKADTMHVFLTNAVVQRMNSHFNALGGKGKDIRKQSQVLNSLIESGRTLFEKIGYEEYMQAHGFELDLDVWKCVIRKCCVRWDAAAIATSMLDNAMRLPGGLLVPEHWKQIMKFACDEKQWDVLSDVLLENSAFFCSVGDQDDRKNMFRYVVELLTGINAPKRVYDLIPTIVNKCKLYEQHWLSNSVRYGYRAHGSILRGLLESMDRRVAEVIKSDVDIQAAKKALNTRVYSDEGKKRISTRRHYTEITNAMTEFRKLLAPGCKLSPSVRQECETFLQEMTTHLRKEYSTRRLFMELLTGSGF